MTGTSKSGRNYTEDTLIERLQSFADELGRAPPRRGVDGANEMPDSSTYQYHFGSWNNALDRANISSRDKYADKTVSGAKYLSRIKEWAECQRCGEGRPPLIDFHHTRNKSFGINGSGARAAEEVYEEVQKCVPLCANCHRLHHYGDGDFTASDLSIPEYPAPIT